MNMQRQIKFKTATIVLVFMAGLSACQPSSKKADGSDAKSTSPMEKAEMKSVVDAKQLGWFVGGFDASVDAIKLKKAYDKYNEELTETEMPEKLEDIPEQFRASVYQDPLFGDFRIFSPNRVSVFIKGLYADNSVTGYSVAAGKKRPLTGQWQTDGVNYQLVLKEPGDAQFDGTFKVKLNLKEGLLKGHWQSADGASNKTFGLKHSSTKYNPKSGSDYLLSIYGDVSEEQAKDPSVVVLRSQDVENLTRPQIRMLRNLMFARHGVSFENKQLRYTFEGLDWYVPKTVDTDIQLTDTERQNIEVLKRYESYAEETYNSFGR